jgi:hypothetical protein
MPTIPFFGAAYESVSPNFSSQTCINLYPVMTRQEDMTKYQTAFFSTPGLGLFSDLNGASVRGMYATIDALYAVCDDKFYQISTEGVATLKGTLATAVGRVSLTSNFSQIGLVDGTNNLYYYDIQNDTFNTVAIPDGFTTKRITFQQSYGIFALENTATFQLTDLSDFGSISTLDRGTVQSSAAINNLIAVESSHLELWLFGSVRTEVWRNAGTSPFPFEPIQGTFIEMGCASPYSIETMDNTIIWLGRDERGRSFVCRADGYRPTVITTEALHAEFETYTDIPNAFSYSYTEAGHTFYVLTFPADKKTWAYDMLTGLWHQRTSWDPIYYRENRHLSNCYAYFNNNHFVGDFDSGKIFNMSREIYSDNNEPIYRERTFPTISNDLKYLTINSLQVDVQSGVGIPSGQGSDPQVRLEAERDGVWSNEMWRTAGKAGNTNARVRWTRLGHARNWIFRISMTDPVPWSVLSATADMTPGTT